MNTSNETVKGCGWEWLLLLGAAGLLGASLGLLANADESALRGLSPWPLFLRQGAFGLLALALAWGIGRFSLHRLLLRHWYVFPALLLVVMIAAPISAAVGSGRFIYGYGWWTRSIGVGAFTLALVFSASFVLPRFARTERGGAWVFAILVALLIAVSLFFLKRLGMTGVGFVVLALGCSVTLPPRKLSIAISVIAAAFLCALLVKYALTPDGFQSLFSRSIEATENFQLRQGLIAVHSGGWMGWEPHPVWIPEWHTDFIFAHLCGTGGLAAGLGALATIGVIFALAWRIASRQNDPHARALAAGCAAAFTVPALLHVAVNLGLFPTIASNFPFLSYAPNLLLLNGILIGLVLSLARETAVPAEANPDSNATGGGIHLHRL